MQDANKRSVEWGRVWAYAGIAFALAWIPEIWLIAHGVRFEALTAASTAVLAAIMFAPAASALVMRLATREGFATAGLRLGPLRWYLLVWLGVPLMVAAAAALTVALGLGTFDPTLGPLYEKIRAAGAEAPPFSPMLTGLIILAQTLTLGVLITSVATFGEEFGWTGYLLVKLLPLGPWRAALLYGLIWGLWHAPIVVFGFNYPGHPWLAVPMSGIL